MAKIFPFTPYRYSEEIAGPLVSLVTQPYDKITPAMRQTYLAQSPYNLVRVILGEPRNSDNAADNVYTRAAQHLRDHPPVLGFGPIAIHQAVRLRQPCCLFDPGFQWSRHAALPAGPPFAATNSKVRLPGRL